MKKINRFFFLLMILMLLSGCWIVSRQFEPEWNKRFEKYTYASTNSTDSYIIKKDGIYRKSDDRRIIQTDYKPDAICVNDRWIVCLVKSSDDKNSLAPLRAITYQIDNQEIQTFKTNGNHYKDILLTDRDELIIIQGEGYCAFDLEQGKSIALSLSWESIFELEGFYYSLKVYQPDSRKIAVLSSLGSSGSNFAVLSEYDSYGSETGSGYAIVEITDDSAYVIFVKNIPNYAYAVYEVKADNTCTELFTIPDIHEGNERVRYQFGSSCKTTEGTHILTMRKMNGWHKTETPSENIYEGDAVCIVSPDWSSYRMLDLGGKKLIGSEGGALYYLEDNDLYRTSAEKLQSLSFEELEKLPSNWSFITFTENNTYWVCQD